MLTCALLLRYDWPSGPETDAVAFPLWSDYGATAEDAHRAVVSALNDAEHPVILDADRHPWPAARETVIAFAVWDPDRLLLNIPSP